METSQHNPSEGVLRNVEPFWHLLYRYFWPFPYFRDVNRGLRMERQQNYRHNRAMRVYLPGFVCKWALLTALCFYLGMALGNVPAPVALTACFKHLRAGGNLLLGWNNISPRNRVMPEDIPALRSFDRGNFGESRTARLEIDAPNRHVFDFYRKPSLATQNDFKNMS